MFKSSISIAREKSIFVLHQEDKGLIEYEIIGVFAKMSLPMFFSDPLPLPLAARS
jgi:hypothetical protein